MRLFWTAGYEATSIADLTAAMNIRFSSLYQAFGSKEALFAEAITRYERLWGTFVAEALAAPTAGEALRRVLLDAAATFADPAKPPGCMVILSGLNGSAESASVSCDLRQRREAMADAIIARLARGRDEGDLPSGTDPVALGSFVMAVIEGLSVMARDGASRERLTDVAALALGVVPGGTRPDHQPHDQR